jgi:hypothetical protein
MATIQSANWPKSRMSICQPFAVRYVVDVQLFHFALTESLIEPTADGLGTWKIEKFARGDAKCCAGVAPMAARPPPPQPRGDLLLASAHELRMGLVRLQERLLHDAREIDFSLEPIVQLQTAKQRQVIAITR